MKTITIYDPVTGQLGPILSGHPDDIQVAGQYIDGAHSADIHMVDVGTGQVIARPTQAPTLNEIRQQRNELLDSYRWTVMPDSPLTEECKQEWMTWLGQLHRLLLNVTDAASIAFPPKPALDYRTS